VLLLNDNDGLSVIKNWLNSYNCRTQTNVGLCLVQTTNYTTTFIMNPLKALSAL